MDFIQITNIIFKDKTEYINISDKDKENAFYMINKKFSLGNYKNKPLYILSQFLNHKNIDKASALDIWYLFFKDEYNVPYWFYKKSNSIKTEEKIKNVSKVDKDMLMEYDNLTENDFNFLNKYFKEDLEYKIKILNRV